MRIEKLVASFLVVGILGATAVHAEARRRPRPRATQFVANKTFGIGLMVGAPTGLAGKYYLSDDTALDFGVGVYYWGYRGLEGLHLHGDFLWHPAVLGQARPFWVPIYLGLGARYLDPDPYWDSHLGIRGPLGIMLDFQDVPLDIFFELALVIDVRRDPRFGPMDLSSALGIRYYF